MPRPVTTPVVPSAAPESKPALTFMIPLKSWGDIERLESRPETNDAIDAARRYASSPVYLAAYVTDADVRQYHADATGLGDELVIQAARFLNDHGVDATRISGRGMGINQTIGRAIVVSLDVSPRTVMSDLNPRQTVERAAAERQPERMPLENRTFKQEAGLPAYRVGPGDVVKVTIHRLGGAADYGALVTGLGTISFDVVEDAPVAGLTATEIESLLRPILKRYYRQPRVTVAVASFASKFVTLLMPTGTRAIPLSGRTTVFDLIVALNMPTGAAGPGVADLKGIRVSRGTKDFDVNVFEIVQNKAWDHNLVLDDGDIVYMPTFTEIGDYVTILGAVGKPGIYPMSVGLTASQAVFEAGGALPTSYLPHARIIRGNPRNPDIIPADVDLVINQGLKIAEKPLKPGDVLYVPKTRVADWNDFVKDVQPTLQLITEPFRLYYFFRVLN